MTLSRTARILIAILLLAAAAFFWVNFFYRDGLTPVNVQGDPVNGDLAGVPTPNGGADASQAVPNGAAVGTPQNGESAGAPVNGAAGNGAAANGGVPANGAVAVNGAAQNGNGDPTVVVPTPEVVTRDVTIADLPFLVTEPPQAQAEAEAEAAGGAVAARQAAGQRISVNPFSPILIQAAAPATTTPPTAQSQAQAQPTVTEVPVPGQQPQVTTMPGATQAVAAPAPRPLAPPAPRADGLPRQLPGGTPLASTPDLLREARTIPEIQPGDLGAVASVREPAAGAQGRLAPVGIADDAPVADAPVEPLGPASRLAAAPDAEPAQPNGMDAPMQAGVDELSRYLRDNNVVFTGSVLGPVSVGVFRSAEGTPLVVSLGQTLPETEIVLTDLTGMKAEFTLADSTQVLSLDLRR